MISTSEAFAAAVSGSSRSFRARLLENNTELDGEIRRVTVHLGSCGESSFAPGSTLSSYAEITVDGSGLTFEGKALELQLGILLPGGTYDYITIGRFTAGRPSASVNETTFMAYGSIAAYFTDDFEPPAEQTIPNVITALSAQAGVSIVLRGLTAAGTIEKDLSGLTCREVLSVIAGLLGGYATERNDGAVVIGKFTSTATVTVDGSRMTSPPTFGDNNTSVTGVRVTVPTDGTQPQAEYESGTPNVSRSDPYMTQTLFSTFATNLTGLTYRAGSVPLSLGDPRLEPWDVLSVTDTTNRTFNLPCMSIIHTFDGGLSTEVRAPGLAEETAILGTTGRALLVAQGMASEAAATAAAASAAIAAEITAREAAIESLSQALAAAGGMYESTETPSGGGTIYYLHNKPTKAESTIVLKLTSDAIGISTDGGATYSQGWNFASGTTITNILSANGVDADWINLYGLMEVSQSKGGAVGGHLGFMAGSHGFDDGTTEDTAGMAIVNETASATHYLIVTEGGVRMTEHKNGNVYSAYLSDGFFRCTAPARFQSPSYIRSTFYDTDQNNCTIRPWILFTNASPTASMAAQTFPPSSWSAADCEAFSDNIKKFGLFYIGVNYSTSYPNNQSGAWIRIPPNGSARLHAAVIWYGSSKIDAAYRIFTIDRSAGTIEVSNGCHVTGSTAADGNKYAIPLYIIGFNPQNE